MRAPGSTRSRPRSSDQRIDNVYQHQAALAPEALTYLEFARDGAKRMSLLVTILLSYAKVTSAAPRFTRVALDDVCLAAMQNLEPAIAESGATIQVEALPEVDGDPALLSQVLQNLIANALKYRSPQPPVVRIAAARRGGQWVISVEDNGIGIAPDDQGRLFKVFGRLHAFADIPGAGIGLASCRRIVELHGGLIWIDSVPGKGSTFSFTIPVAR